MNRVRVLEEGTLLRKGSTEEFQVKLPAQVHEVLVQNGKMQNPIRTHDGTEAVQVSGCDWVYTIPFSMEKGEKSVFLKCRGLDTIADIYLNSMKIGRHEDMFYPFECKLENWKAGENKLEIYFHSPVKYLENIREPDEWKGKIPREHYLRKAPHDFEDFLGIKPCFPSIGIFNKVELHEYENSYFKESRVRSSLESNGQGKIVWNLKYNKKNESRFIVRVQLMDPEGKATQEVITELNNAGEQEIVIFEENPHCWWPVGYGKQNLYTLRLKAEEDDEVVWEEEKKTGFRKLDRRGDFDFYINGVQMKLWGANLVPITGITHVFDAERAKKIMQLAKDGNMNILRVWGGGEPYPEELYQMADEEGILIWTEMFHKWGMYPDSEHYMKQYRKEAEYMLRLVQRHPSVIIWSGGNESFMGAELDFPLEEYIGKDIFSLYRELIEKDTDIFYIENSPYGGAFHNDPRQGDFHGWNHLWYVPYDQYPVFFSENSRVSTPGLKSLKKYIPDKEMFWPQGFVSHLGRFQDSLLPESWQSLKTGPEPYWCSPVEQFYDADNPEELIYRCGAAHAQFMKRTAERLKRGRPAWDKDGKRRCKGQLIWKFNDSWPQIFCSLLDYDLEPGHAYYGVKRGFEPLQVSFAIEDNITIWGVNDTKNLFKGTMEFVLFSPILNETVHKFQEEVEISAGQSVCICDLDRIGMFKRENLLYACLKNENGEIVSRNYEFVEIERNFYFPEAKLSIRAEGHELVISTDSYARCIELNGNKDGEEFGFFFEDNYFDLLPFEIKKVKVKTDKKDFIVSAKAFYSKQTVDIHVS